MQNRVQLIECERATLARFFLNGQVRDVRYALDWKRGVRTMTYSEVDRSMLLRCLDAELWRKTQDVRAIFVSKTQNSPKLYVIERMLTDLVGSQLVEHRINPVGRFSEYRLAPGAASKIESNTGPQAGALVLKEFV